MSAPLPTAALPAAELAVLAELAEARSRVDPDALPCLLRVRRLGDDVELGWRPLPAGTHPIDVLVGWSVPADWDAIGFIGLGTARRLDEPGDEPVRVHSTHLVGRDGSWASRCTPCDGESMSASGGPDDPARVVGRVDDACRRALDLPTAPPELGTAVLFAAAWLDSVVESAVSDTAVSGTAAGALRWPAVARLHPAVPALLPDIAPADVRPARLGELAAQLSCLRAWPELRRACAAGTWTTPGVSAALAGWLDDGAFSRWALGAYPDLHDLWATVADLLPRSVAVAVAQTLVASGAAP